MQTFMEAASKYMFDHDLNEADNNGGVILHVENMTKEIVEDSYEEGEIGNRQLVHDEKIGKDFNSIAEFKEYCNKNFGIPNNPDYYVVIDNRIIATRTEDQNGNEITPNDSEWKDFIAGNTNLFTASYDFLCQLIVPKETTEEALREFTGISN